MLLFDELSDRPVSAKNTAQRAAARAGLEGVSPEY